MKKKVNRGGTIGDRAAMTRQAERYRLMLTWFKSNRNDVLQAIIEESFRRIPSTRNMKVSIKTDISMLPK